MRRTGINAIPLFALLLSTVALAAVPEALHFSGRLDTGGTGLTGTVSVVFTLYTDPTSTGSDLWTDTQTLGVSDGRFHAELTGVTNTMLAGGTLFLGIQVESDPEMSPRIALRSVPYARQADNALKLDGKAASEYSTGEHTVDTTLEESDVEGFITNAAINLAAGSTVGGESISTGAHTVEVDPLFVASAASTVTTESITNWDAAFSWGDHGDAGYLTSFDEDDPKVGTMADGKWCTSDGSQVICDSAAPLLAESDSVYLASDAANVTTAMMNDWDTAYGWGNHADGGYSTGEHNTYSGSDFALSDQSCAEGLVVTGVDSSGTVICAAGGESEGGVIQNMCAGSFPTQVCKRDVFMEGQTEKDVNSIAMLSGGQWVYNEDLNRCEYSGGTEHNAPENCGIDLMPGWMDTSDLCGGFRQSSWDTRIWYAVAKDNKWEPDFEYTCPPGFHWASSDEVGEWFNGPDMGAYVYHDQCGWSDYVWDGKTRKHFRFSDSKTHQGVYKHAGHRDPYTVQYDTTTLNFAGIVCVDDATPGPTDWMDTSDECGGFRQSDSDPRFRFAVSRKNKFDPSYNYQCPEGYHWATTAEGLSAFNSTLNQGETYYNECGWTGYDMHNNGINRKYFLFNDSYKDSTTQAFKHAGNSDMFTVEFNLGAQNFSDFAGIVCMNDNYVPTNTDWMLTSDGCDGFRQSTWDPRFSFAVSANAIWDKDKQFSCPSGYHWATTAEVDAAFTASNPTEQRIYHDQCGWSGYLWDGVDRRFFRMSDSDSNDRYMHAGNYDPYKGSTDGTTSYFAGIVCMKNNDLDYPTPGTTDWMQTDDDCKGFRRSSWDNRVRYAVARQNIWDKDFTYTCPEGYHWGSSTELGAMHQGTDTGYDRYYGQCGWGGYLWHGRERHYFRLSDSVDNNRAFHAGHGDPSTWAVYSSTANFAGIVCIQDDPPNDPTAWMSKNDNCGGFRQSSWDESIYFAVAKQNVWDPSHVYTCPDGYEWISTAQAEAIWPVGNSNYGERYYGHCGWYQYSWNKLNRKYFRFSDSHVTNGYKHSGNYDSYQVEYSSATAEFAGIVCQQITPPGPTDWMDTTDNCGGFRQSLYDPDVYYAVGHGNVWDKTKVYECPAGFHWASTEEGNTRFPGDNTTSAHTYHGECGWSEYWWNDTWPMGCNAYSNTGCGSAYNSASPTMMELRNRPEDFASGCDECEDYFSTTCVSYNSPAYGEDGDCDGVNETHWRNAQHLDDCYYSANNFSGTPASVYPSTEGDHCHNGVCCGNNKIKNITRKRVSFRFSDSATTNAYKHAGYYDGYALHIHATQNDFAGIVCIRDSSNAN